MKESSKLKGKIEEPTMPAGGAKRGLQLENIYERYEDQLLDASKEEFQYAPNHNGSVVWLLILALESIETN